MKIGLFTEAYFPIISGVSVSVDNLKKELEKLGHDVIVVTNDHPNAEPRDDVIRFKGMYFKGKSMQEYQISKVTRAKVLKIKEQNFDIIHCHTEFTMGRLGRKAARKFNIPVVHTYHTMYEDYIHHISKALSGPLRFASKIYSRSFANSADEVIFPTIKVKKTFDSYGYDKPYHIIPSGIYIDHFRKINFKKEEIIRLRSELGITEDDFVLLFLGRLAKEKSIDDLIIEFEKCTKDKKNIKLLLVGGGPDIDELRQVAIDLKVEDKVIFTGMIPPKEVKYYYQCGDLFVNFSTTETQGLTYIEALASGLPVLAKYDTNLEGVVIDNFNGVLFYENNEFCDKFTKLMSNQVKLQEITDNSSRDTEKYSAKQYALSVEAVYKNLLK